MSFSAFQWTPWYSWKSFFCFFNFLHLFFFFFRKFAILKFNPLRCHKGHRSWLISFPATSLLLIPCFSETTLLPPCFCPFLNLQTVQQGIGFSRRLQTSKVGLNILFLYFVFTNAKQLHWSRDEKHWSDSCFNMGPLTFIVNCGYLESHDQVIKTSERVFSESVLGDGAKCGFFQN